MIRTDIKETLVDNILVELKTQHRIEVDDQIVPYLKENGYSYLVVEKCDQTKFKEMLKSELLENDYDYIKDYIKRKVIHYLYLKPINK